MTTLQDKMQNIYRVKREIKSALGTDSDVFSEYPDMIRSMAGGGVSYSYLDERLSYYVETSDLHDMSYVSHNELESMGYITIEDVPQVDLSSYVTYTYLESKEYLTEIPDTYATYAAISEMGYITYSYGDSIYVSYAYIGDLNEITEYILGSSSSEAPENVYATKYELGSYVSYTYLENKKYATESYVTNAISNIPSVDTSSYVTYTYLESKEYLTEIPDTYATYAAIEGMGYITQQVLDNAGYITSHQDLSGYIAAPNFTYDGQLTIFPNGLSLNQTGQIHANWLNYSQLKNQNYHWMSSGSTRNMIYGILAETNNVIPIENNTYTLGDADHIYDATYTNAIKWGTTKIYNDSNSITFSVNNYGGMKVGTTHFSPRNGGHYTLGTTSSVWESAYVTYTYTDNIYNNTGKTRILTNDRNIDLWSNNKKLINLSDYNGFIPTQSNFNLGSSNNAWGTTYTSYLYVNGSDIESRIAAIEAYLGLNQTT